MDLNSCMSDVQILPWSSDLLTLLSYSICVSSSYFFVYTLYFRFFLLSSFSSFSFPPFLSLYYPLYVILILCLYFYCNYYFNMLFKKYCLTE